MRQKKLGVGPAHACSADEILGWNDNIFEKHFVERVPFINGPDRPNRDAGRPDVDQEKGNSCLRLGGRIGSDESKNPVGIMGFRRPCLLTVDQIMVALQFGAGSQRCQVRA